METETEIWNGNENENSLVEVETEMEWHFPAEHMRKRNFCFMVIWHDQSSRPNM
jgi:hypothetical protein